MQAVMPLMALCLGTLAVLGILMLTFTGPSPDRAKTRRLKAVGERHNDAANSIAATQMRRITNQNATRMDAAVMRLLPNPAELKKRLSQTGKNWTLGQFGNVTLAITSGIGLLLWFIGLPILLALLVGIVVGTGIPLQLVNFQVKRRIAKFTAKFPDALELLVRGLRSGLPIAETMSVIATEVDGPVGIEFRAITDKMKIGRTMDAALQETSDRLGTPEFQFFVITIAIQRETGGNLAETLSNLATVLRTRGQMKLKIKAMSSESKASAYIVGSLPFIVFGMIWFINSSYMQNFFIDQRLMVAGGGGLVWMGIGVFIMSKMVNFEI